MNAATTLDRERGHAMVQERWDVVWERSRAGRHTVVVGPDTLPPAPSDLQVLHVRCDAPGTNRGVLDAAHRQVAHLLGEELRVPEPGQVPFEQGLRQRFLGDMPGPSLDALLVEACNRLANRTEVRTVLAFEAIDAADEATVATLAQILQRPGWLRLPLLLTVRNTPQGQVAELVYLLCHEDGEAAVIEIEGEAPPIEIAAPFDWTMLPADVLRVLRAGAVLGTTFEATLVARLLEEPLGMVLEKLQVAVDAGVPLADRGEGQFTLPPDSIAALRSGILPSLLRFWHARLGEILSGAQPPDSAGLLSGTPRTGARGQRAAQAEEPFDLSRGDSEADLGTLFEPVQRSKPPTQTAQAEAPHAPVANVEEQISRARQRAGRTVPPSRLPGDPTRAAAHLQAAGRTEEAVEHYLAAVREAAARGDARRAYGLVEQALTLLDPLPLSPPRALLRARLWLERGRLQWHGALLGSAFTLQEALASLEVAKASLPHDTPPEVVEQLAAVTAGVCYDLGDRAALQRALDELRESSQRLVNAGEILPATRLLNDQAAVYMRLGDPVSATYLLSQSRERFESHLRQHPRDEMAIEALAETEHLLARLPLHVPVPPGREEEAYARSLEHARAAEQTYQRLGQHDKLTRVWETMGRLALQQGHLEAAQERLTAALHLQQQLSDVSGLARSTAALADLCMLTGQLGDAVSLLADSIMLNGEKGSPIGLAFNRQTLGALARAVAQAQDPGAERLQGAVADLESRLAQAESILGRVGLPGEAGAEAVTS
jgi:tetratricopeptide (TPR) repeat protein